MNQTVGTSELEKEWTEQHLERLSTQIIEFYNTRDYDGLLSADYLSTSFKMYLDYYQQSTEPKDLASHVEEYKLLVKQYPEKHLKLTDAFCTLGHMHRIAHVYHNMELTGHPPGVVRRAMGIFEWRMAKGRWLCVKWTGMLGRGGGAVDGMREDGFF